MPLVDHLLRVAERSKLLIKDTGFDAANTAFYSGLLHDIGKLNPWYQEKFSGKILETTLNEKYVRKHSIFSAWIADHILSNKSDITEKQRKQISCIIAGHHTVLRNTPQGHDTSTQFENTQCEMYKNLYEFSKQVKRMPEFMTLSWDKIYKFKWIIDFESLDPVRNYIGDYLETRTVFSSLLQADRGSFDDFPEIVFDIHIEPKIDESNKSKLNCIRTEFQKKALAENKYDEPILILEAPTGIGKTKLFLDMIQGYKSKQKFERVYYFSPLLALTDDFESTLMESIPKADLKHILEYNHAFTGTVDEKERHMQLDKWRFEMESFNMPFIITTMQRFLITLYSNNQNDLLKFISFKKSLLILDEVQTIPKFLLPNILQLLKEICYKMNSRVILVSATIPHELKDSGFPIIKPSQDIKDKYLDKTKKLIKFSDRLILPKTSDIKGPILVMNNTRRKAVDAYDYARKKYCDKLDIMYMSSGIRKSTRKARITKIKNKRIERVVVSTQVMEAGVNVSFTKMFREMAPLDNIIQAMGRLDRNADADTPATLEIFKVKDGNTARPYTQLEFEKSESIIENIKKISTSLDLYECLDNYYQEISSKNESNRDKLKKLENAMGDLDFDEIWKFVKKEIFIEDGHKDVIIPPEDEYDDIRKELIDTLKGNDAKTKKRIMKKFAKYTASLPIPPDDPSIKPYFDAEIREFNILFPAKNHINELYDGNIGLDKWIKKL